MSEFTRDDYLWYLKDREDGLLLEIEMLSSRLDDTRLDEDDEKERWAGAIRDCESTLRLVRELKDLVKEGRGDETTTC